MNTEQLQAALPKAPLAWLTSYVALCSKHDVTDLEERAMLLAQLAHESAQFTRLEENLSYSAERLCQVWPRRFPTPASAAGYAHNPEALANYVYADRMGNGPVTSGDGWSFRGRGPIQLTGRQNYTDAAAATELDLIKQPGLLCLPNEGLASAWWFWVKNKCRGAAQEGKVAVVTQKINGGLHGLEQRKTLYIQLLSAIR